MSQHHRLLNSLILGHMATCIYEYTMICYWNKTIMGRATRSKVHLDVSLHLQYGHICTSKHHKKIFRLYRARTRKSASSVTHTCKPKRQPINTYTAVTQNKRTQHTITQWRPYTAHLWRTWYKYLVGNPFVWLLYCAVACLLYYYW